MKRFVKLTSYLCLDWQRGRVDRAQVRRVARLQPNGVIGVALKIGHGILKL